MNKKTLNAELDRWQSKWSLVSENHRPIRISNALGNTDPKHFPHIYETLKVIATILHTIYECDRSISALHRVKTYLRGTMRQERKNGLTLQHIHRGMELNYEEMLNMIARNYPRRMQMLNILKDNL